MSIKYKGKTISGPPGTDGKSAYEYAVEGGYTGTEDEFKTLIASGPWLPTSGGFVNGILSVKGDEFRLLSSGDNVPPLVFDFKPDENGKLIFDIYQFLYGGDIMLRGLESPLYDDAAANKKYVDDKVAAVVSPINLISITFGEESASKNYTVSANNETYTGMVPENLQAIVSVKQPNTEYTIICGEISKNVISGPGFGLTKNVNMFDGYKLLIAVANVDWATDLASVLVEQDGDVLSPRILNYDEASGFFVGYLSTPGEWKISIKKYDKDYTQEFSGYSTVFITDPKTILTIAPIWN